MDAVWNFLNSPLGVSLVIMFVSSVIGKILLHKPKWKEYADKYGPFILQVVKRVEKEIPDNIPNAGAVRLDKALKYILAVCEGLDENALAMAINAVHAKAETNNNLKKK